MISGHELAMIVFYVPFCPQSLYKKVLHNEIKHIWLNLISFITPSSSQVLYPANMLPVTVSPMQKGAMAQRVRPLMAPMTTAMVRPVVIIASASVHFTTSLEPTSKAPPLAVVYAAVEKRAWGWNKLSCDLMQTRQERVLPSPRRASSSSSSSYPSKTGTNHPSRHLRQDVERQQAELHPSTQVGAQRHSRIKVAPAGRHECFLKSEWRKVFITHEKDINVTIFEIFKKCAQSNFA